MAAVPHFDSDAWQASPARTLQLDLSSMATGAPREQAQAWHELLHLLEDAQARDCYRLHVEPGEHNWRLRFRSADAFSEEIISNPAALQQALQVLQHRLWGATARQQARRAWFVTPLNGSRVIVQLDVVPAASGDTCLFTLQPDLPYPARLDELDLTPAQARTLRSMLMAQKGWLVVTCSDPVARSTTLQALAQETTAPDRKVLCVEPMVHHILPRTTQIILEDRAATDRRADWQAALALDNDIVLLGTELTDSYLADLHIKARSETLVVQSLGAQSANDALQCLRAQGMTCQSLAEDLSGILVQHRLRRLCPHCKQIASLDKQTREWLDTQRTPVAVDIMRWLDDGATYRYLDGAGCEQCRHTGFTGTMSVFDITSVSDELRSALRCNDIAAADAALAAEQQLHTHVMTLARQGETSLREAMRVIQQSSR